MKKAIIVLAEGFEEIEAVCPIDVLRRAGIHVSTAAVENTLVEGAHGISIAADTILSNITDDADALIFPGGLPGAENLAASKNVSKAIQDANTRGAIIAAICASPAYVLAPSGILAGRKATCYPGCEEGRFSDDVHHSKGRVVRDGNIITSRGPGTAIEFSLAIVEALVGKDKAQELRKGMLVETG